jgi:hypothetical protein
MSLDVYLIMEGARVPVTSGIFIREGGSTKEITANEWNARYPDREPVVLLRDEESDTVYSANITHNLNKMAGEANIYLALWRPGEMLDPETSAKMDEQAKAGNYHGAGGAYELERTLPKVYARDLIEPLEKGLALLKSDPIRFMAFNPSNGWGSYHGLVSFTENYLNACKEYPDARVEVSR